MYSFYGVATIRCLLQITGLFCKSVLQKRRYSAKEAYNFKEPTHRSHPIPRRITRDMASLRSRDMTWGRYDQQAPSNYTSLLQNTDI